MAIDPTARVADGARIGQGTEIGPYCLVGPQVELGPGVRLIAHVNVTGVTTIGEGTVVYPFASLGTPPQSVHYRGGATRLVIGARCELRECVTMNTGTEDGGGVTLIGSRCVFMAGSHVGHDCQVGDAVTLANNAALGGHVCLGDHAFLGGQAAVHQNVRIGEGVMVAGLTGVAKDLIPFGFASGQIAFLAGLNIVGLTRRGVTRAELHRLRNAYRTLFFGVGIFADRIDAVDRQFANDRLVGKIISFIRAGGKRALMHPRHLGGAAPVRSDEPSNG
jgi:UDP-N-acetylglucosamine acyltransferase